MSPKHRSTLITPSFFWANTLCVFDLTGFQDSYSIAFHIVLSRTQPTVWKIISSLTPPFPPPHLFFLVIIHIINRRQLVPINVGKSGLSQELWFKLACSLGELAICTWPNMDIFSHTNHKQGFVLVVSTWVSHSVFFFSYLESGEKKKKKKNNPINPFTELIKTELLYYCPAFYFV